ncbi:hypothetical protein [Pedobacter faecalis]|uniref:hypothetical protein n=1 Tax=Pedobacter faecalis TaxID=3041495 RepID=UPI00254AE716|nr:hypothetical protein [Pedobacter sp. ELA7]
MRIRDLLFMAVFSLILWSCGGQPAQETQKLMDDLKTVRSEVKDLQALLAEKETTIYGLQRQVDSLQADTLNLGLYNPALIGRWRVSMKCTETNCDGSAVGDSKSEQWLISYTKESIMVQVLDKGKLSRTYTGVFTSRGLQLEDPANVQTATITVAMLPPAAGKMEGKRFITQADCRIVYDVSAELMDSNDKL